MSCTGESWVEQCPDCIARCARNSLAPLGRSSTGLMPARTGRLSAGVGRRHPVTVGKASLMAGSMSRVWSLCHQKGTQYSAIELMDQGKVAVRSLVSAASQIEPASCLRSTTRDVSFCKVTRGVGGTWAVCPTVLEGIWARSKRAEFLRSSWLSDRV